VLICSYAAAYLLGHMTKRKNPHAVALGKLGGSKGGKIRAAKLTSEERSKIARNAVLARWEKARKRKDKKHADAVESQRG
jgi:hypothetical protein